MSEVERSRIVEMRNRGLNYRQIAIRIGCHRQTVYNVIREFNLRFVTASAYPSGNGKPSGHSRIPESRAPTA